MKLTDQEKREIVGCMAVSYKDGRMNIYRDKTATIDCKGAERAYIVVGYEAGNIKLIPYAPATDFPCWRSKII